MNRTQFRCSKSENLVRWSVILLFLAVSGLHARTTRIQTKFGTIEGLWSRSTRGRLVAHYLGIPYAEPPIGYLRFKGPQPWSRTWNTTYYATKDGSPCIQRGSNKEVVGSEDCLYLNVYVPIISDKGNASSKLPVIVFVHGGRYVDGSSDSNKFPPNYLMDQNIILVAMNFRLGVLGFFSMGNKAAPGNYGVKDVVESLRWIQENIEAFNGDPNSVTLWGNSVGAALVHALTMTPKTEGLFHRYILQSGSAFSMWGIVERTSLLRTSMEVVERLGCLPPKNMKNNCDDDKCVEEESKDIMCCMRAVEDWKFASVINTSLASDYLVGTLAPTLEEESEDAILTVHPLTALRNRMVRDVPCIIGINKDEGDFISRRYWFQETYRNDLEDLVPVILEYDHLDTNTTALTSAIEDFYFDSNFTKTFTRNISQALGDEHITWPTYMTAKYLSTVMNSSIYFYLFNYVGTFSSSFMFEIGRHGVTHCDDLNYLIPHLNKKYKILMLHNTETDETMINIMTEMWASFATNGVPRAWKVPAWPDFKTSQQFLLFGNNTDPDIVVESDFFPERMAFWEEMTKKYNLYHTNLMNEPPIKKKEFNSGISYKYNKLLVCLLLIFIVCLP
ncbi:esterase FE4-like [Hylaeus anthracinus]|uniref:esterase FE4-like n=1 Tax=Hylaeus anthracinus TaxID=313031 RepID=UPI0023BA3644|nr:esterase FE4-like [Hylaeus anthracinus]